MPLGTILLILLILMLLVIYLILGTALDGLSAMVMTLPVALPLITAAGFDKVWFGVASRFNERSPRGPSIPRGDST